MSFKLGNTNIGELYIGSNKIAQAYLGSNLVYQAEPPAPSFDEVTIGTQTWMAKNLAIDDGQGGIIVVNDVTANGVNFGTQYYYTWDAAVRIANSVEGWHLPSKTEWETMINYLGGSDACTILQSSTGWNDGKNGTDNYGFCALPVGYYNGSQLTDIGYQTIFWTSQAYSYDQAYKAQLIAGFKFVMINDSYKNSQNYSVRLIKD